MKATPLPPELRAHQQWLGFVQPIGLVVSLPALEKAQCYVNRNTQAPQQALLSIATGPSPDDPPDTVADLRELCTQVLGWKDTDLVEPPDDLAVAVPEHGETLRPTYVVPAEPASGAGGAWLALVSVVLTGTDLDNERKDTAWPASPQTRFERLLRESGVPIGLLFNGHALRLVYAPRGESSGHVTFSVASMAEVAGRPILAGMVALLSEETMFSLPEPQRLPTLLRDSRRYQSEVSTRLSEQVLEALRELLAGFQVADDATSGLLLREALEHAPEEVYGGLLATLLRLVFLLYAEDRGLMGQHEVYLRHYAVTGLFEKLREEQARFGFFGSSMKDDLRYTPSDCFETFPFPRGWETDGRLEEAGRVYHEFRAKLMADDATRADLMAGTEPEGLTATYNRFHDPDEALSGILELRRLHAAMDRAVLVAYGWTDLDPSCQFLLDYEEDEAEEGDARASKKKKPWRYRWPDEVRDEVLARLLALNAERAEEERLLGEEARLASPPAPKKAPAKKRAAKKKDGGEGSGELFS